MFSRDFVPVAFSIPYHRYIPMDKYMHLSFLLLFPVDLIITRYPEIHCIDPRISCAYCLAVICHMNTHTDNSSHLPSIRSTPVVRMFHKAFEIRFNLPKNLSNLLLWNFLLAFIMINPISLVILLASFVIINLVNWFNMLRMLAILNQTLEFVLPASDVTPDMSWLSVNQTLIGCRSMTIELIYLLIRASASGSTIWK